MADAFIRTVTGDVPVDTLGLFLPHEHLFTDLRGPSTPGYAQGDPEQVARVVLPHLQAIERQGVTALVECSTMGVGRNIAVLRHLASLTPIRIIAPTGVYKEGFIPEELLDLSVEVLAELWVRDLTIGIDGTTSRAGFIKVGLVDDGPTELEIRNLKAAVLASQQSGAVIASHTIGSDAARREISALEAAGHDLTRFIWVHAQTGDAAAHVEAAQRGVWVEFDSIGGGSQTDQTALFEAVFAMIVRGFTANLLLSHDAGWYDPSQPDGEPKPNGYRGYTALVEQFIPALKARGVSDEIIHTITVTNPAKAFGFAPRQP
ncbi:MAG: esterase [Chloroflexi bacterium]|nr:esterase [Chloroflexota bacterium]